MIDKKFTLEAKVLTEITPTCEEGFDLKKTIEIAFNYLNAYLSEGKHGFRLEVEGSVAKKTNLKGASDIDVFVLLEEPLTDSEIKFEVLPYIAGAIMAMGGVVRNEYASHPYLSTTFRGFSLDIVPAVEIDCIEDMYTAVDRTQLHTRWVLDEFNAYLINQTRIFKQFLKAHGLYGASEEVNGFSGYLCEVLIHHYGSFWAVLEDEFLFFSDTGFVPDPVDPNRNVAAALSLDSLCEFINACRDLCIDLLTDASVDTLIERHFRTIPNRGFDFKIGEVLDLMEFCGNDRFMAWRMSIDTMLFSQFAKEHRRIVNEMADLGFRVVQDAAFSTGLWFYSFVEVEASKLSPYRVVEGPPVGLREAGSAFKKKHDLTFIHKGMYLCREPRTHSNIYGYFPQYVYAKNFIFAGDTQYEGKIAKLMGM